MQTAANASGCTPLPEPSFSTISIQTSQLSGLGERGTLMW